MANGPLLHDGEEADLVKQLLEEYLNGRVPGAPCAPDDTYRPVGLALLVRLNRWFGHADDDGIEELPVEEVRAAAP